MIGEGITMNSQLRSLCVVVVAGLLLSSATGAAQPVADLPVFEVVSPPSPATPPPPAPPNERTLVVDVSSKRGPEPQLMRELSQHLRRSGLMLTEGNALEPMKVCDTPMCLEELARRENAGILLSARVEEGAPTNFAITMALYDAVRRTSLNESADCLQCSPVLLSYKINDLADKLIAQCREGRPATTPTGQALNTPGQTPRPIERSVFSGPAPVPPGRPIAAVEKGYFERLSPRRKALASVLGGLAGAALVSSLVLTLTNGRDTPLSCEQRMDVLQDKCILKNTPLFASGYVLTGALVVGIGFTLFWPQKRTRRTPATTIAPTTSSAPAAALEVR